eukprot:TRINITY_DN6228_c0_g1_i2.p1 TRINITY_DN6228_c0_g1~~TRINITY_DN6228_c0_g1_i2.p1  ORF type:complete len:356 (+),score=75.11 TRINITY_DN6228_c0_g1_i2:172-1239(+)
MAVRVAFGARRAGPALQKQLFHTSSKLCQQQEAYINRASEQGAINMEIPDTVKDLSLEHEPLGHLVNRLPNQADVDRFRLTDDQLNFYHENGYVANIPVLTEDECDRLIEELTGFQQPTLHPGHGLFHEFHSNQTGDPNAVLMHCLGHWRIQPGFHDLIFHPAISIPASQVIDPDNSNAGVRFWHDQLFCKPANHGGNVAYHQDYSYWTRTAPMRHLTVHIALDAQDPENGSITYIPGSHRWHRDGMPLPITADDFADMDSIRSVLNDEELSAFEPVSLKLKRGEAVIHHPLSVHGSFGNTSPRPRRAAVVNYMADGTISKSNEPLLAGATVVPDGQKVEGQLFPLVYNPEQIWA